ncbi:MAG: twin-arginine translocase TatA/TatE family subunit [Actinomycetota bacterium]|nr:twin-arginine translocase TatA/TatE family subunit [Actinomycetota bacterium]
MPGSQELLVIALVALFVLGPERLPEVARAAAKLLTRIRNYGVTASKELRGVADLGDIEREITDLRRELDRTRSDLRRAMRETVASSPSRQATHDAPDDAGTTAGATSEVAADDATDAPDGRA